MLYKGERKKLKSAEYLYPHAIELKPGDAAARELRRNRETRTSYLNITEIVVSLWLSYFFAKPPKIEAAEGSALQAALPNIDGKRRSLIRFLRDDMAASYLTYGKVAVLADSFGMEGIESLQDQRASGARPFLEAIEPLELVDWSIEQRNPNAMGELLASRQEYTITASRDSLEQEPQNYLYTAVRDLSGGTYRIRKYKKLLGKGLHDTQITVGTASDFEQEGQEVLVSGVTELPIVLLEDESWLKDVAEEALRHYNLRSGLDNVAYYQGYQKIFAKGVDNEQARKALSEYIVSFLPENGDAFAIESVDTAGLERLVGQSLESCFKVGLNQLRSLPSDSKETQSADASNAERLNTTQLVEATIEDLENASNRALEHFAILAGEQPGKVSFNREIGEPQLETVLMIYSALQTEFDKYQEIPKALVTKLIYKMFDPEQAQELADVVENTKTPEPAATQRTTLLQGLLNERRAVPSGATNQGE